MKVLLVYLLSALSLISCATSPKGGKFHEAGGASWYGGVFHGRKTASGELFDKGELTAAHRTLPFGTMVCVRSKKSRRQVTVRINDRGPFARQRIVDLSEAAAGDLGILKQGEDDVDLYVPSCP